MVPLRWLLVRRRMRLCWLRLLLFRGGLGLGRCRLLLLLLLWWVGMGLGRLVPRQVLLLLLRRMMLLQKRVLLLLRSPWGSSMPH